MPFRGFWKFSECFVDTLFLPSEDVWVVWVFSTKPVTIYIHAAHRSAFRPMQF